MRRLLFQLVSRRASPLWTAPGLTFVLAFSPTLPAFAGDARAPGDVAPAARSLAETSPACTFDVLAQSMGVDIPLMTLAAGDPAGRPAVLVVAGLDGGHTVGWETALRVAANMLAEHAELLNTVTVYVLPLMNPDGAAAWAALPGSNSGTSRPFDDDHDGLVDEDPPVDLDGNGLITVMRQERPPLGRLATHREDPAAPRLLVPAKTGEHEAVYAVFVEGLDADGDGRVAEDGPGAVALDRNFMHRWPEHEADAGPHALSERESLALARFVIEHPEIVATVTYGRHDNVVHLPDGKAHDRTGRTPKELAADDLALHKELAECFRELTGQTRAPKRDSAGAFHAWTYAQRGIASFATVVRGAAEGEDSEEETETDTDTPNTEPDAEPEAHPEDDEGADPDDVDEADAPVESKGPKKKPAKKDKPVDEDDATWLRASDDADGAGFVEWAPFDHATLGPVEIGGFVPGFRENADEEEELASLAEGQLAFLVELIDRRPRLSVVGPVVTPLAGGLVEIRLALVNDGKMPTATAQAGTARPVLPTIVRLSAPLERIVAGERVSRVVSVPAHGGRSEHRWIVRAEDGDTIEIIDRMLGTLTVPVRSSPSDGNS